MNEPSMHPFAAALPAASTSRPRRAGRHQRRPLSRAISPPLAKRRRQAGTAYIIALLVLVVLTLLGLSLMFITQVEMEVGSNERVVNRTFYGAQTGVGAAIANALDNGEYRPTTFDVRMTAAGAIPNRGFRIATSHFVPIQVEICNWCPANENEAKYYKVNHVVNTTAQEVAWIGSATAAPVGTEARATKLLSVMLDVQPLPSPPPSAIPDPPDAANIKY